MWPPDHMSELDDSSTNSFKSVALALRGCSFGPVKRAVKKSFAKVLRRRMFERADGSGTRVTTAPWRTNFLAGFRAIPGLVSLGTFFASKESTSATPKAFLKARRQGENPLHTKPKTSVRNITCRRHTRSPPRRKSLKNPLQNQRTKPRIKDSPISPPTPP